MTEPPLSVIISTYNRARHLELALIGWARQSYRNYEVIVVDDGCDDGGVDGTAALLERWKRRLALRVLRFDEPRRHRGRGEARNRGLRAADGDRLVIADDDCVVNEDFLRSAAEVDFGVGRRRALVASWARHLPGCWTPRLRNLIERNPALGARLGEAEETLFDAGELERRFEGVLADFSVEDPVWERLEPAAEPGALGWLFGMAGPLCVERRAAFEAGLYDPLDDGRDLEVPELAYRVQVRGLAMKVIEGARSFRVARQWQSWPRCGFEALKRFLARHDPVDAWLLLRFLAGESIVELNRVAATRAAGSVTDAQLALAARELVPQLVDDLRVWWYRP